MTLHFPPPSAMAAYAAVATPLKEAPMPSRPPDDLRPATINDRLDWYIVRSATLQERRAVRGLAEAGFEAYLPSLKRWQRVAGVKRKIERPLFPGYLFVGLAAGQSQYAVTEIDGVHAFLRLGSTEPLPISPLKIAAILLAETAGEFDKTRPTKADEITDGTTLRVIGGPFLNHIVTALGAPERDRVKVLYWMFGREGETTIPRSHVLPLGGQEDAA